MKLTRRYLRSLILEQINLITEEEADAKESGTDDSETPSDELDNDGEAKGGDESETEDTEDLEDDKEAPTSSEAIGPVDDTVDTAINAVMLDFEKEALEIYNRGEHLKQGGEISLESKRTLSSLLFEEESAEPSGDSAEIDLDNFSSNVARLIKNYTNLLDMEQLIFTKAQDFLTDNYGEEAAREFKASLEDSHDITFGQKDDDMPDSYAIGAAGMGE